MTEVCRLGITGTFDNIVGDGAAAIIQKKCKFWYIHIPYATFADHYNATMIFAAFACSVGGRYNAGLFTSKHWRIKRNCPKSRQQLVVV